jgi:hypothetical protein
VKFLVVSRSQCNCRKGLVNRALSREEAGCPDHGGETENSVEYGVECPRLAIKEDRK